MLLSGDLQKILQLHMQQALYGSGFTAVKRISVLQKPAGQRQTTGYRKKAYDLHLNSSFLPVVFLERGHPVERHCTQICNGIRAVNNRNNSHSLVVQMKKGRS